MNGNAADAIELVPADYFRLLERREIFPDNSRPLEIDVGCGDGSFLLEMAQHHPERDFLGIERLGGRVSKVCRRAARMGLQNVRVLRLESSYTLGWLLPDACASRLHLLFPDPWPKKRHAKNRFINPDSVPSICRVLQSGGEFLFKTDHPDYFEEATAVVDASGLLVRLPWLEDGECYPLTDFEQHWLGMGKSIQAARWRRA